MKEVNLGNYKIRSQLSISFSHIVVLPLCNTHCATQGKRDRKRASERERAVSFRFVCKYERNTDIELVQYLFFNDL